MINEAEIRRLAAQWQVDPMILDLDYSLTWFLGGLAAAADVRETMCFKGGTCLRKCYFPGYRFSEDLDFTAVRFISEEELVKWVEQATDWSNEKQGPDFLAQPPRFETVEDEYGRESFQVRVYFRGPLNWGGSPRAIRLDVTRDESVLWPTVSRRLIHSYSDSEQFAGLVVACYSLEEVLAEKVRAVCGQRRFAISRDLYDLRRLVREGVSIPSNDERLMEKFLRRGVDPEMIDVRVLIERKKEYELDWERRLDYLVPGSELVTFEEAWATTLAVVRLAGG